MVMAVQVDVTIPNVPASTVTIAMTGDGSNWTCSANLNRTCPICGQTHTVPLVVNYSLDYGDVNGDVVSITFGGDVHPNFPPQGYSLPINPAVIGGFGTQSRRNEVRPFRAPRDKLLDSRFDFTIIGMPIYVDRSIVVTRRFIFTLPFRGAAIGVYEDAGGGVAGAFVTNIIPSLSGLPAAMRTLTPERDFVLRVNGIDYPFAIGDVAVDMSLENVNNLLSVLPGFPNGVKINRLPPPPG